MYINKLALMLSLLDGKFLKKNKEGYDDIFCKSPRNID